jgi:hypothetical protein
MEVKRIREMLAAPLQKQNDEDDLWQSKLGE